MTLIQEFGYRERHGLWVFVWFFVSVFIVALCLHGCASTKGIPQRVETFRDAEGIEHTVTTVDYVAINSLAATGLGLLERTVGIVERLASASDSTPSEVSSSDQRMIDINTLLAATNVDALLAKQPITTVRALSCVVDGLLAAPVKDTEVGRSQRATLVAFRKALDKRMESGT